MATIEKRGDSYKITVSVGYGENKKQKRVYSTYTPDPDKSKREQEREVKLYAAEFEKKVKGGRYFTGENIRLKDFVEKWMKEYAEQELEESTVNDYKGVLRRILPKLGDYKLGELNALVVKEFFNGLKRDGVRLDGRAGGYGDKTIMKTKQVLSIILSTAVEWGMIETNPCTAARLRSSKKVGGRKIKHFTYDQAKTFLEALDKPLVVKVSAHDRVDDTGKPYHVQEYTETRMLDLQFRFLFNLALFSGCRREELLALTWNDFNFNENTLSINKAVFKVGGEVKIKATKTESSNRTISLPESVMRMAKEYRKQQLQLSVMLGERWEGMTGKKYDENYVFIQWNGKRMYLTTPSSKLKKVIQYINNSIENEKEKLPQITLHGLRHTSATLLIAENVDAVTVAGRLGHSDTSTTLNIYAHALQKKDQEASKILGDILERNA